MCTSALSFFLTHVENPHAHTEDMCINFGLEDMGLQKIEIPELSLSPWRMLGPVRHRFCRALLFQPF